MTGIPTAVGMGKWISSQGDMRIAPETSCFTSSSGGDAGSRVKKAAVMPPPIL